MPKKKSRALPKADLVVYRDQSGAAYVSPGTLIASKRNGKIYLLNFTKDIVSVTIPVKGSHPLKRRSGKNPKMDLDISKLPIDMYLYEVKVGKDIAIGNSSPRLIIDE